MRASASPWSRRASSPRFSEAYWEADDDLAWLRMVRDELARTGHLREEVRALVEAVRVAVAIEPESAVELEASADMEVPVEVPLARPADLVAVERRLTSGN